MMNQKATENSSCWENDIQSIENCYTDRYPNTDIVFFGSSSIRLWNTLAADFSGYSVVNHGFGGSRIADATYYYDRLVTPFSPKVLVVFSGTNDIHGCNEDSKTGKEVYRLVVEFFEYSRSQNPDLPVYYISISPTESRWHVWKEVRIANQLIAQYAKTQPLFSFIDTTDALLNEDGTPNNDLFQNDHLHLNDKGYAVWTSIIKPIVTASLNS